MAVDSLYRTEATAHFQRSLEAIKGPLTWSEATKDYDQLLADLGNTVSVSYTHLRAHET